MATITFYDHTTQLAGTGALTGSNVWKVVLVEDGLTLDTSDTTLSEVTASGANEVYGNNWPSEGAVISNVGNISVNGLYRVTGTDVSVAITGGNLGPFGGYLVTCTVDSIPKPLYHVELDSTETVFQNNLCEVNWNTTGIIYIGTA